MQSFQSQRGRSHNRHQRPCKEEKSDLRALFHKIGPLYKSLVEEMTSESARTGNQGNRKANNLCHDSDEVVRYILAILRTSFYNSCQLIGYYATIIKEVNLVMVRLMTHAPKPLSKTDLELQVNYVAFSQSLETICESEGRCQTVTTAEYRMIKQVFPAKLEMCGRDGVFKGVKVVLLRLREDLSEQIANQLISF